MDETTEKVMHYQEVIVQFFIEYGIQIIGALIILAIGLLVARWLGKLRDGWLTKYKLDAPIRQLFVRIVRLVVMVLVLILVLDKFGVQIAPLMNPSDRFRTITDWWIVPRRVIVTDAEASDRSEFGRE